MEYDDFVDYEDTDEWHELEGLLYDWEDVDITPKAAEEHGFDEQYRYCIPSDWVWDHIKAHFVHDYGMSAEEADAAMEKNPGSVYSRYIGCVNQDFEKYAYNAMRTWRSDDLDDDEWRDNFFSDSGIVPDKFNFGYYRESETFGYDEFAPEAEEYLKDKPRYDNYEVGYSCEEMGFDPRAVFVAGSDPIGENFEEYGYLYNNVPDTNMYAALKCCLVYVDDKNPEDVSMEYIDENFDELRDKYDVYVRKAFFDEACEDHDNVDERMEEALNAVPKDDRSLPEDLLTWKPRGKYRDFAPQKVRDARMKMLSYDDQLGLENIFAQNTGESLWFEYEFFNGKNGEHLPNRDDWEFVAKMCCEVALRNEDCDPVKMFKASSMYDSVRKTDGKVSAVDTKGNKREMDVGKIYQAYINSYMESKHPKNSQDINPPVKTSLNDDLSK